MKKTKWAARVIAMTSALVILACILAMFTGCTSKEEQLSADALKLQNKILELHKDIAALEKEKNSLEECVTDLKVETGTAKYVLTINIKQTHYTLDLAQHMKDAMNDISIKIPVDKEYYDSVNVGDVLDDSFRMGSFIFKGSFGSWRITIQDKTIM